VELEISEIINTDILVIGGGAAGLRAAIEAKKYDLDVMLTSESPVGFRNNTAISAAGFAATGISREPEDSPEVHLRDTITAGRFINDRRMVETMTRGARQQVYDLTKFGVNYVRHHGELLVLQSAGHTYPRSVGCESFRGINITRPMRHYAASIGIQFIEGMLVTKLLWAEDTVVGALAINDKGQVVILKTKSTILATGGGGDLYLRTDNARGITGDGYALAHNVGATLRDMEFVQLYPTAWGKHGARMCSSYETFLSRGATLRNSLGEDILKKHGIADFSATRDMLTRIIMKEIAAGRGIQGNVIFDLTTIPKSAAEELSHEGLMRKGDYTEYEKVLVAPTVHFFMGGVKVSINAETEIHGLYAAGEVCGGMHGANRLGDNAITETLVFGTIAGDKAATTASKVSQISVPQSEITFEMERLAQLTSGSGRENLDQLRQSLKQTMWDKVGAIRDGKSLGDAQREIVVLQEQLRATLLTDYRELYQAVKLANMLTVSEMVCRAALTRTESRGTHYRADYPEEDRQWLKVIEISYQSGEMALNAISVKGNEEYWI